MTFNTPIESMGPYYSDADLNDQPVSKESTAVLEKLIAEAQGSLACEIKEDGFRCQVHVNKKEIKLFTRGSGEFELRCFPEIMEGLQRLQLKKTIFDGELRGTAAKYDGFKAMQARARYKSRISEKALKEYLSTKPKEFPLQLIVFDLLMHEGKSFMKEQYTHRRAALEEVTDSSRIIIPVSKILTHTPKEIISLYAQKIKKEKHEGLVLKQLNLDYLPGDKTHWVKLKKFESLDLVILGFSTGEHQDRKYGQALVGAYHPEKNTYQTLGFVNLVRENPATGNVLADDLRKLAGKTRVTVPKNVEVGAKKPNIYVNPEVVVEVRVMNIDRGTDFACSADGKNFYSLRIAYVKNIREDKTPQQATTSEFIVEYYKMQR